MTDLSSRQRALAVNAAFCTAFMLAGAPVFVALDQQPLEMAWQVLAVGVVSYGIACAFLPLLARRGRSKAATLAAVCVLLFALPLLIPETAGAARFMFAIFNALLAVRLFDLYLESERRRAPDRLTSAIFLASFFFVFRKIPDAPVNLSEERARFVRRSAQAIVVATLLVLSAFVDWRAGPFLLEHSVKAVLLFMTACAFFNALVSMIRLLGGVATDFADAPATARTPADFWRRYNRWMHEWLYEDVFKVAGGLRSPVRATLVVFAFSGLLHEWLFTIVSGTVHGYQLAYFALQGVAVAMTVRWKPKGWMVPVAILGTLVFNLLISVLFFVNASLIEPFYTTPIPRWLRWY